MSSGMISRPPNVAVLASLLMALPVHAGLRTENFDIEPAN